MRSPRDIDEVVESACEAVEAELARNPRGLCDVRIQSILVGCLYYASPRDVLDDVAAWCDQEAKKERSKPDIYFRSYP